MTPQEQARERAEVMIHFANGGEVELLDLDGIWKRIANPGWDWSRSEYRIVQPKPKKVKFYQWLCSSGGKMYISLHREETNIAPDAVKRLDETMIEVEVPG